ncbi:hypothetical protein PHLCEN_2v11673 [Hermanssonia centrifuga]|uniref:Choline/carnitine acyltransferase domain-containing protein n=1 Tax=Hermanssonia centrifuga TaxID=98765 RepID=A0A2R6NJB2_9APHY|nr:hypothetical protein PHLCEN_2v11673 [Hermanssonia centrifuga]
MASNTTRPPNWKSQAPTPIPGETFAAQTSLPRLPVPPLVQTLDKLTSTLRPIAYSAEEFQEVKQKILELGKAGGFGETLQKRLEQRASEREHWLEEWWDDGGYLGYRDSVRKDDPGFESMTTKEYLGRREYGFKSQPVQHLHPALHRAASLVRASMLFRQQFKLGKVPPERTRDGPLCMDTWRWMFDCCRIPGLGGLDWSVTYAKPGDEGTSGHVVVLRKGRFWKLEPWIDGRLLSVPELEKYIFSQTSIYHNFDDYALLAEDPKNASILTTIHSAAFVLCLDTEQPSSLVEHSRALWHGSVTRPKSEGKVVLGLRNRWVDKPVQFIVFDNGEAGIMGEHSVMDGTPTVALCDAVLDMIASPELSSSEIKTNAEVTLPQPLDWIILPATTKAIETAETAALSLIESQEMGIVRTSYGKKAIKAFGVSPDSWAQMIVQLAYARLVRSLGQERQGGTYEAATTRRFFKGRTEAIRVVSEESDRWVASMDEGGVSAEERKKLLKEAVKKHGDWARMAGSGLGIDRHMLGLKLSLKDGEELPALYSDPVFKRSSNWVLSTSAIFSKHFGPYGWGEVVPEGFGVAYMTGFDGE